MTVERRYKLLKADTDSASSYTPAWTASTSNPAIGNGTISGLVLKHGNKVTVQVTVVMGSTTTFGSGPWSFSVPHAPNTAVTGLGSAYVLDSGTIIRTGIVLTSTTASVVDIYIDSEIGRISSAVPHTWASGDELRFSITYLID